MAVRPSIAGSVKTRLLVFAADEIKKLSGGGRGVILMGLDVGEKLVAAQPCGAAGVVVEGQGRGGKAPSVIYLLNQG